MRSNFQQAQSPLSIVRLKAYLSISSLIKTCLDHAPAADAIVPAIDKHAQSMAVAATAALQERIKSPSKGERGAVHNNNKNTNREVTDEELVAILSVLQVSCLLSKNTRRAVMAVGAIPALVSRLVPANNYNTPTCLPPAEVTCRCLDVLIAIASQDADAHQQLCTGSRGQLQCIHSICTLLKLPGASDKVKTHAARALNLMLTHIPAGLTGGGGGGVVMGMNNSSDTPGTGSSSSNSGNGNPTPTTVTSINNSNNSSQQQQQQQQQQVSSAIVAQVNAATMAAQQIVGEMLGKESKSMISRKISLINSMPEATEEKIIQLANALSIFIDSDNNPDNMGGNDDDHGKEEE
jgi:hypothetical protein